MGFDILDGMKGSMAASHSGQVQPVTDNIGFGENHQATYAKAEKMLLQDNVQCIICYSNSVNAEALYKLAESSGCPFIFLDAGMQLPNIAPSPLCYHLSLQGVHACRIAGNDAGKNGKKILMATSFYDGGYKGPWGYHSSIEMAGGSICGNYVSTYKEAEFSISSYISLLQSSRADGVAACFSSYLAELFINSLSAAGKDATALPFYCSPFMAEEQMLSKCTFPGGNFHVYVPWTISLSNMQQQAFTGYIKKEKNKQANIFHLLGWEAGIVVSNIIDNGSPAVKGWSYESPRGRVTIHAGTHHTYAPLYYGNIVAADNNTCCFRLEQEVPVSACEHLQFLTDNGQAVSSGWKNNYLCI
jgi:branched-chain amino acid transport system substrate-binding protein